MAGQSVAGSVGRWVHHWAAYLAEQRVAKKGLHWADNSAAPTVGRLAGQWDQK